MNSKRSRINDLRRDTRAVAGDPNRHFLHRNQTDPFNGNTLRTQSGNTAARALVLVRMYWCGCRHPLALFAQPLHPPTGLVRWLSGFKVQEQVDHGRLLLARLAEEEQRMFEFALRLTERIDAMTSNRARGFALLPELLSLAESQESSQ